MKSIPYIDIHTHLFRLEKDTITVQNIYPGDGFAAFQERNFYSAGIHPWHIDGKKENNKSLQLIEKALAFKHVVFVGEAGLDKIIDNKFSEQIRVFEAHVQLAEEYKCPMIIHCVKAYTELIEIKTRLQPQMPWILHGYNGSLEQTKQLEKHNFFFSFGKNLFRESSKAINSFKYLALNKLFLETDELEWKVEEVYRKAANHRAIEVDELKLAIWENFNRVTKSKNTEL